MFVHVTDKDDSAESARYAEYKQSYPAKKQKKNFSDNSKGSEGFRKSFKVFGKLQKFFFTLTLTHVRGITDSGSLLKDF